MFTLPPSVWPVKPSPSTLKAPEGAVPVSRAVAPPGSRTIVPELPLCAATVTLPASTVTSSPSTLTAPPPTSETIVPLSVMIWVVPPLVRTSWPAARVAPASAGSSEKRSLPAMAGAARPAIEADASSPSERRAKMVVLVMLNSPGTRSGRRGWRSNA
ncbi:hypothetical protein [Sphingomonas sp. Root720]|uniref:hypothetical protein n=1 Tax=Sphingomonas sp. Root720 TaxID=1736595 RepID=UPI0006F59D8F|nr:hypothetical protein [Sphingomonas sp. Root720]KQY69301.1 hypothetical protein ASD39_03115 [Sphingomonas sp. Root50]KRB89559.1 hypothetical protein ASE22_18030 [Sphingomonas sp. Root720]